MDCFAEPIVLTEDEDDYECHVHVVRTAVLRVIQNLQNRHHLKDKKTQFKLRKAILWEAATGINEVLPT